MFLKQSTNTSNAFDSKNQNTRFSSKNQQVKDKNTSYNRGDDSDNKDKIYVVEEKNESKLIKKEYYNIDEISKYQNEYYANEN